MNGSLVLEGGAEFGGGMALPDRQAIALAGGPDAPVRIIPTAAAPDRNHLRAGGNAERWFKQLGARDVQSVGLIDRASAQDPLIVESLRAALLIYLLGGFTHYLAQTLLGSPAWEAVLQAWRDGAVLAGSSAGAMVLCQFYFDPSQGQVCDGLGLVPGTLVLPHHNTFGKGWAARLAKELPAVTLLGIDEQTGLVSSPDDGRWSVLGAGAATLYRGGQPERYLAGSAFTL